MTPLQRARIARNMEYHQQVADQYSKAEEERVQKLDEGGGQQPEPELDAEGNEKPSQEAAIAQMHTEAAQQLRDLLGEVQEPAYADAMANRPVIRDVTPIRQLH